jgi:NADH:ubiquinone oxidoreductase subunit 4 (subunit M)
MVFFLFKWLFFSAFFFNLYLFLFYVDYRQTALKSTIYFFSWCYILILLIWFFFDINIIYYFYLTSSFIIYLDKLSLYYLILTIFIFFLCSLIFDLHKIYCERFFILAFIFLFFCILNIFSTASLFIFFIFFELLIIPMCLIVGLYGTNTRKINAIYLFYGFSVFSSILFFITLSLIYLDIGTTDILVMKYIYMQAIPTLPILIIFFCLFIIFIIKIPSFPFYIWLPEVHVEAPVIGSIILASILLKIGSYGLIKFLLSIFYFLCFQYCWIFYFFFGLSIIFASLSIFRQLDIKRIIAYSSIIHMNVALYGIFSFNVLGFVGGNLLLISHSFISAALFFLCGILYDRFGTRLILYFGGFAMYLPIFSLFLFIFLSLNGGFPLSLSFLGEILIFIGLSNTDFYSVISILSLSFILSLIYNIWTFTRISFGTIKLTLLRDIKLYDLTHLEYLILIFLSIISILLFFYPFYIDTSFYLYFIMNYFFI